jgi:hypothetical protein
MSAKWTRVWFAATAGSVLGGLMVNAIVAANGKPLEGHFHSGLSRALNSFAYFTTQSNLLVGLAALLLALRLDRSSTAFRVLRLCGLVAITVTGIVFHAVLAQLLDLQSWARVGNDLVHTVVPVVAVVGWLMLGPRRLASARVVWLSLIFPVLWLAFTLIRGAIIGWYPYPFIDVTHLGYDDVALNCVWVALLMLGLAAGAAVIDQRLAAGGSSSAS